MTPHSRTGRGTTRDDAGSSVQRSIDILELLGSPSSGGALGVVEIARALGREKSQVSRALRLLADAGFVDREPHTRRYRIGTRLFALAAAAVDRRLRDEADRLVRRVSSQLGERVEVAQRSGTHALAIATCAPDNSLQAVGWVGRTFPLHCTAAGRCLLFDLPGADVARVLTQVGLDGQAGFEGGPGAPRSLDEVLRRLDTDRRRGWAVAEEETDHGLLAVAAPVFDASGRIVAAINASGPESRLRNRLTDAARELLAAAGELSGSLGAPATAWRAADGDDDLQPAHLGPRRTEGAL